MDLARLSTPYKIAIGGALVLLIDSFLNWYAVSGFGVTIGVNAWDAGFLAWGAVALGVAAGVVLVLKASGKQDVQAGGKSAEQIAMILGITALVLAVLRLLTETSYVAYGLFIGIAAAAAVAYGSWQAAKTAGPAAPGPTGTPPPPAV